MDDNPIISCNSHILPVPFRRTGVGNSVDEILGVSFLQPDRLSWITSLPAFVIPFLILLLLPGIVLCKNEMHAVRGRVIDASTKRGLPFANILVENTNYRVSTDGEGDFRILLPSDGSNLVVSYVGYKTASVKAGHSATPILIRLSPVGYIAHEVKVVADRIADRMQNSFRLGSARIEDFAGITRDPFRALQLMPGVSTDDEASAKMDVRGGTWDENTVLIDGAEIYDPFHLKEVSLASLGVFNEDVVKSIDFSPGGFGAKYGDALSSITSIHYREGNREHLQGSVNLSPLDLSASVEGPIGKRLSFIVAARGSYLGYMLKDLNVSQNVYGGYFDLQGNAAYHPDKTGKLQADFLYSKDNAVENPFDVHSASSEDGTVRGTRTVISRTSDEIEYFGGDYSNSLISISYHDVLSGELSANTLLYYTRNTGHEDPTENTRITVRYGALPELWTNQETAGNQTYNLAMNTLSIGEEMKYQPSAILSLDAGAGIRRMSYDYNPDMYSNGISESNVISFPDTTISPISSPLVNHDTITVDAQTYEVNCFMQGRFRLTDDLDLNPGLRFDYFDLDKEGKLSPRVNIRFRTPLGIRLTGAWGIYYQLPAYNQIRMSAASDSNTQFQESTQFVLGLEKEFIPGIDLRVQFYQKYYSDLIPAIRTPYGGLFYSTMQNDGSGFAKGFDLQYNVSLHDLELSVSYSYLVAKEKSAQNQNYYPRLSDQRHTASMDLVYSPWNDWTVDIRGFYGSGYAYTPTVSVMDSATMLGEWVEGAPNSAHYPAYERLDVRVTRSFKVLHSPMQLFVDVTNVLDRKNVWAYRYVYDSNGNVRAEPMTLLGIVPTIGMSYRFGL